MKCYQIEDVRHFMAELLSGEKYDSFYLYEANINMALNYNISGKINSGFYSSDEISELNIKEYITWGEIKPVIYDLIKGKRLPIGFRIILMFNRENITRLVEMNNLRIRPEDISSLVMNINYGKYAGVLYEKQEEEGNTPGMLITTGTSLNIFTLDKTIENLWNETVEKYYI